MKYEFADDIQREAEEISRILFPHIKMEFVRCIMSLGTSTKRTIARCHGLGKVFQKAMGVHAFYVLEFLHEQFDKLSYEDKTKTIIHELMHIPKAFGGGFKHHDYVTDRNVNLMYKTYMAKKIEKDRMGRWF